MSGGRGLEGGWGVTSRGVGCTAPRAHSVPLFPARAATRCVSLHSNKHWDPTWGGSPGITYVQGSVVLGNHAVRPVPTDIGQHQKVDRVLLRFGGHTHAPCRWTRGDLITAQSRGRPPARFPPPGLAPPLSLWGFDAKMR